MDTPGMEGLAELGPGDRRGRTGALPGRDPRAGGMAGRAAPATREPLEQVAGRAERVAGRAERVAEEVEAAPLPAARTQPGGVAPRG